MSDIVETLRKGEDEGVDGWWFVMAEAANEIERLRAENETLRRDVKTAVMGDSAELQDVKRENEKLHREAAIRIDQIEREQEAHLRTIADYNRAAVENEKLHQSLEQLGLFFVKIGDRGYYVCEAVAKEIEKLREALKLFAYNYQDNGLTHSTFIFEMKDLLAAKKALESGDE